MTLRQLEYVVAVADHLSFRRAAEASRDSVEEGGDVAGLSICGDGLSECRPWKQFRHGGKMERDGGKPRGARTALLREHMMYGTPEERVERHVVEEGLRWGLDDGDRVTSLQKRAAHLQHAMNNPLTALLAEGQLLSMEEGLTDEHRESVDRMIDLTRRMIALVRSMDDLRGSHPPR